MNKFRSNITRCMVNRREKSRPRDSFSLVELEALCQELIRRISDWFEDLQGIEGFHFWEREFVHSGTENYKVPGLQVCFDNVISYEIKANYLGAKTQVLFCAQDRNLLIEAEYNHHHKCWFLMTDKERALSYHTFQSMITRHVEMFHNKSRQQ